MKLDSSTHNDGKNKTLLIFLKLPTPLLSAIEIILKIE